MVAFNATTRRYPTADRDNLDNIMDFDHPIRVADDGGVYDADGVYAPDVFHSETDDVTIYSDEWEPLTGFTGQYGYRGAVMNPSEYIGGGLADHILSTPGTYVAVVVYDPDDTEGEPAGWAILKLREISGRGEADTL